MGRPLDLLRHVDCVTQMDTAFTRISPGPHFSAALQGPTGEGLRARLLAAFGTDTNEQIEVVSLFEITDGIPAILEQCAVFLVVDLQRVIVFRKAAQDTQVGLASLVRFLLDGYPLQPFGAFASGEVGQPFRFAFDLAVLDCVPALLEGLGAGEYATADLMTGELSRGALIAHPGACTCASSSPVCGSHAPSPLRPVFTGAGLRTGSPPDLGDLIDAAAGVVRTQGFTESALLSTASVSLNWECGSRQEFCHGKAFTPREARAIAVCEAVERFQVVYPPPGERLVRGSYRELATIAVDPASLFFGSDSPDSLLARFDPDRDMNWTWAWGPALREWRLVPAREVWWMTPPYERQDPYYVSATTSGCAAGSTFEEAAVFGLLEAVERDAFLTSWYLRRPARQIDPRSFELEPLLMLAARFRLAFPNYKVILFDLTSDVGLPTVGGLAMRESGSGSRAYLSAATHIDPQQACFRALKDLTWLRAEPSVDYLAQIRRRADTDRKWPDSPIGHVEYYTLDQNFAALAHLADPPECIPVQELGSASPIPPQSRIDLEEILLRLDLQLRTVGASLFIKDMTHPACAARGLHTARAITPGLYPLWFGLAVRRFAVTDRLRALAQRYTGRALEEGSLQLLPHPLG